MKPNRKYNDTEEFRETILNKIDSKNGVTFTHIVSEINPDLHNQYNRYKTRVYRELKHLIEKGLVKKIERKDEKNEGVLYKK